MSVKVCYRLLSIPFVLCERDKFLNQRPLDKVQPMSANEITIWSKKKNREKHLEG